MPGSHRLVKSCDQDRGAREHLSDSKVWGNIWYTMGENLNLTLLWNLRLPATAELMMAQFIFGLLAGIIVGLVMEWVIDWTGLFPNRSNDKKDSAKAAQGRRPIPSRPRAAAQSATDVAPSLTDPDGSGE